MPTYQDLTLGFSNQVPRRLTRFTRTGDLINNWLCPPVCLIVRVIQHLELGQDPNSPLVEVIFSFESTGAALSSTGCTFPSSRNCSSKEKRATPSLVPDH